MGWGWEEESMDMAYPAGVRTMPALAFPGLLEYCTSWGPASSAKSHQPLMQKIQLPCSRLMQNIPLAAAVPGRQTPGQCADQPSGQHVIRLEDFCAQDVYINCKSSTPGEEGGLCRSPFCRRGGLLGGDTEWDMDCLLWWLKDGEEEGGVHSPEALPLRSGVGSPGGRGGLRRRPAVVGVNANLSIPLSCAPHTELERSGLHASSRGSRSNSPFSYCCSYDPCSDCKSMLSHEESALDSIEIGKKGTSSGYSSCP